MAFKGIFTHFVNYISTMIKSNWAEWSCMACGPFFGVELILIASLSNRLQCETCPQCQKNTRSLTTTPCMIQSSWCLYRIHWDTEWIEWNVFYEVKNGVLFRLRTFLTILKTWKSISNLCWTWTMYKDLRMFKLPVYKLFMLSISSSQYRFESVPKVEPREHQLDIYREIVCIQ